MEMLAELTHTTTADLKTVNLKKASIPQEEMEYVFTLKKYTNLTFAFFGPLCPLFLDLKQVIKAMLALKKNALKALKPVTKASIYWTIFLQSKHFFSGETTKLAEFKVMLDNLTAKQANISHAELTDALVSSGKHKQEKDKEERKEEGGRAKYRVTPHK
eukprot:5657414-Ditylum_brightwellii.AAC.1